MVSGNNFLKLYRLSKFLFYLYKSTTTDFCNNCKIIYRERMKNMLIVTDNAKNELEKIVSGKNIRIFDLIFNGFG